VVGVVAAHELDRDLAAQPGIDGEEHLAMPPWPRNRVLT